MHYAIHVMAMTLFRCVSLKIVVVFMEPSLAIEILFQTVTSISWNWFSVLRPCSVGFWISTHGKSWRRPRRQEQFPFGFYFCNRTRFFLFDLALFCWFCVKLISFFGLNWIIERCVNVYISHFIKVMSASLKWIR